MFWTCFHAYIRTLCRLPIAPTPLRSRTHQRRTPIQGSGTYDILAACRPIISLPCSYKLQNLRGVILRLCLGIIHHHDVIVLGGVLEELGPQLKALSTELVEMISDWQQCSNIVPGMSNSTGAVICMD